MRSICDKKYGEILLVQFIKGNWNERAEKPQSQAALPRVKTGSEMPIRTREIINCYDLAELSYY